MKFKIITICCLISLVNLLSCNDNEVDKLKIYNKVYEKKKQLFLTPRKNNCLNEINYQMLENDFEGQILFDLTIQNFAKTLSYLKKSKIYFKLIEKKINNNYSRVKIVFDNAVIEYYRYKKQYSLFNAKISCINFPLYKNIKININKNVLISFLKKYKLTIDSNHREKCLIISDLSEINELVFSFEEEKLVSLSFNSNAQP
jgi:hypothetical protein